MDIESNMNNVNLHEKGGIFNHKRKLVIGQ